MIRDVPDEVLAAIDANAKRVGLSRTDYLLRTLEPRPLSQTCLSQQLRSLHSWSSCDD